ncbi:MAG: hypothetical protein DRP74_05890 [Candidatus Omnitrophota bacterium]|nr:MAG: hypothetical protein DRP74_05890 [Candidatus Omnitrophota bacterium]
MDKQTPEEKLLKLIEDPAQAKAKPVALRKKFKFNFNPFSFLKFKSGLKPSVRVREELKNYFFNLKFINTCLLALSVIMTGFLIFDFIKSMPDLECLYVRELDGLASEIEATTYAKALPIQDYLSVFAKRDMFYFVKPKEGKAALKQKAAASITDNYKLVGIIWSKKPQAMIEDVKGNKTVLVNQGDDVGQARVSEILKDRVILVYQGSEIDLM